MFSVFDIQNLILSIGTLLMFGAKAWALVDAVSHKAEVFVAAEKMTKQAWVVILGVALAANMLIWHPINLINIIGTIAALVYLVDARPALRSFSPR